MAFNTFREWMAQRFGRVRIDGGDVAANLPALDITQTWNNSGASFTGLKFNVKSAAASASSSLLDLQVDGVSKFRIDQLGRIISLGFSSPWTEYYYGAIKFSASNGVVVNFLAAESYVQFNNSGAGYPRLHGESTNAVAQRTDTNAQEFRLYATYTSATAYQRLSTKTIREAVTCAAGASVTTTISVPKFTHLIGVTTRITTAIGTTNSTTGYKVGDGTDDDLWGAITGTAQGTTSDRRDFTAVDALGPDGADRTITLTAVGGNFDGTGVIEVCAYYLAAEAD